MVVGNEEGFSLFSRSKKSKKASSAWSGVDRGAQTNVMCILSENATQRIAYYYFQPKKARCFFGVPVKL